MIFVLILPISAHETETVRDRILLVLPATSQSIQYKPYLRLLKSFSASSEYEWHEVCLGYVIRSCIDNSQPEQI